MIFSMVNKWPCQLSVECYEHYTSAYVKLERLETRQLDNKVNCAPKKLSKNNNTYQESCTIKEIAIDGKVLRINLTSNSLNLKIASEFAPRFPKRSRMYNNNLFNKSILKQNKENECDSPSKTVSFNNTFYINPISPRQHEKNSTPIKDYEFAYKEYLKSVQMNGACSIQEKEKTVASPVVKNNHENEEDYDDFDEESMEVEYLEEPKRKRGRPKGSGKLKASISPVIIRSSDSPPKKRGWPLGLSRKTYMSMKRAVARAAVINSTSTPGRKRGRPRKIIAFGFQTIVSDIKTVSLPSDLWSAHVSVTAKKSQVCFTRVVQAVSNSVPVECDRSVKFNGSVNYLVRINNREVELLAAPPTVNSLRDVEILLEIVNEIGINDPVLEYHNR